MRRERGIARAKTKKVPGCSLHFHATGRSVRRAVRSLGCPCSGLLGISRNRLLDMQCMQVVSFRSSAQELLQVNAMKVVSDQCYCRNGQLLLLAPAIRNAWARTRGHCSNLAWHGPTFLFPMLTSYRSSHCDHHHTQFALFGLRQPGSVLALAASVLSELTTLCRTEAGAVTAAMCKGGPGIRLYANLLTLARCLSFYGCSSTHLCMRSLSSFKHRVSNTSTSQLRNSMLF